MITPRNILAIAYLSLSSMLSGCATAPDFTTKTLPASRPVSSIYMYSFIDMRERELGSGYMLEIQKQLDEALTSHGVRSKQLWFNQSAIRSELAINDQSAYNSTIRVPVREVIESNAADQMTFDPTHVLIVVPTETTNMGTGYAYTLTWRLVEVKTGDLAWSSTSQTSNVNWLVTDEMPAERARVLVKGLMKELERSRLLTASTQPAKP